MDSPSGGREALTCGCCLLHVAFIDAFVRECQASQGSFATQKAAASFRYQAHSKSLKVTLILSDTRLYGRRLPRWGWEHRKGRASAIEHASGALLTRIAQRNRGQVESRPTPVCWKHAGHTMARCGTPKDDSAIRMVETERNVTHCQLNRRVASESSARGRLFFTSYLSPRHRTRIMTGE